MASNDYRIWQNDEAEEQVHIEDLGDNRYRVVRGETSVEVDAVAHAWGISVLAGGRSLDALVERDGTLSRVKLRGQEVALRVQDERRWRLDQAMAASGPGAGALVESPMAGKVVLVRVEPGETVQQGQTLVIIEAMKMENEIRAVAEATVAEVCVAPGETVNPGDVLVRFVVEDEA